MEIIEHYIESKTKDMKTCEDGYIVCDHFAAIVDGATNKSTMSYDGQSPGRIATRICLDVIQTLSPDCTAHEAYQLMNTAITNFYKKEGILEIVEKNPTARCTASSIIYSDVRREIWFLGDCMAMVNGQVYQFQKDLDQVLSNLRSLLIHVEISRGAQEQDLLASDVARKRIIEFLQLQMELQNSPYECEFTYHVLDGIAQNISDFVQIVSIGEETREIILSSDGYPQLYSTLQETEQFLAKTIAEDPLCYKIYKSTKGVVEGNISYDDRTYLRLSV